MSLAEHTERTLLEAAVSRYEAEGFDVFVHPSPSVLPGFLRDCRPDAIALRSDRKIAVEIAQPDGGSAERVKRLQERLAGHNDWEFVLLYVSPRTAAEAIGVVPPSAIEETIRQVLELRNAGQLPAALMVGWAALEAAARKLMPEMLARPQPSTRLVEVLAGEGYLTPSEADSLRSAAKIRNAAAHGQLDVEIQAEELDALLAAVRALKGSSSRREARRG